MFKFIKNMFASVTPTTDQVMIQMHDNVFVLSDVTWRCNRPFASPYGNRSTCLLSPGGDVIGQSYIKGWVPATEGMNQFFYSQPKAS